MIRVRPAEEPPDFDANVRRPGLRAVAELAGETPPRAGNRRHAQVAESRDDIPAAAFPPYWRESLGDLLAGYGRVCSYLCLYIPRGTGAPSVDHMVAKSMRWDQVYEWRNYRLACALMNSRKGAIARVLDPFEVEDGWFALELVEFQVVPNLGLSPAVATAVEDTIDRHFVDGFGLIVGHEAGKFPQKPPQEAAALILGQEPVQRLAELVEFPIQHHLDEERERGARRTAANRCRNAGVGQLDQEEGPQRVVLVEQPLRAPDVVFRPALGSQPVLGDIGIGHLQGQCVELVMWRQ